MTQQEGEHNLQAAVQQAAQRLGRLSELVQSRETLVGEFDEAVGGYSRDFAALMQRPDLEHHVFKGRFRFDLASLDKVSLKNIHYFTIRGHQLYESGENTADFTFDTSIELTQDQHEPLRIKLDIGPGTKIWRPGESSILHPRTSDVIQAVNTTTALASPEYLESVKTNKPNSSLGWILEDKREVSNPYTYRLTRPLTAEDLRRNPLVLEALLTGSAQLLESVFQSVNREDGYLQHAMGIRVLHNTVEAATKGIEKGSPLTEDAVRQIVNATIEAHPLFQQSMHQGLSREQVLELVSAVMEERFAALDQRERRTTPSSNVQQEIQQLAGGNPQVEEELETIATRLRDPERVFKAALKIAAGFIPGAQGVIAIIEAANDLFGPIPKD